MLLIPAQKIEAQKLSKIKSPGLVIIIISWEEKSFPNRNQGPNFKINPLINSNKPPSNISKDVFREINRISLTILSKVSLSKTSKTYK